MPLLVELEFVDEEDGCLGPLGGVGERAGVHTVDAGLARDLVVAAPDAHPDGVAEAGLATAAWADHKDGRALWQGLEQESRVLDS